MQLKRKLAFKHYQSMSEIRTGQQPCWTADGDWCMKSPGTFVKNEALNYFRLNNQIPCTILTQNTTTTYIVQNSYYKLSGVVYVSITSSYIKELSLNFAWLQFSSFCYLATLQALFQTTIKVGDQKLAIGHDLLWSDTLIVLNQSTREFFLCTTISYWSPPCHVTISTGLVVWSCPQWWGILWLNLTNPCHLCNNLL